ncbi:hypothetical protein OE88DRAFT_1652835 [Heliocybe sulcata]|uniref:Uncharacterized protein n=1 Tax=Heliocybe sulcata TaxID=5364 RepID=A0A5C3NEN9_9AGAM|nr:hypothetical protein OE88DRAFT_1652835 [Heliocybe sulcata]
MHACTRSKGRIARTTKGGTEGHSQRSSTVYAARHSGKGSTTSQERPSLIYLAGRCLVRASSTLGDRLLKERTEEQRRPPRAQAFCAAHRFFRAERRWARPYNSMGGGEQQPACGEMIDASQYTEYGDATDEREAWGMPTLYRDNSCDERYEDDVRRKTRDRAGDEMHGPMSSQQAGICTLTQLPITRRIEYRISRFENTTGLDDRLSTQNPNLWSKQSTQRRKLVKLKKAIKA